jgi:hypothetical protein
MGAVPVKPGRHLAIRRGSGRGQFVVHVRPPLHGGRGFTVTSRSGAGPMGELNRLLASGWRFRRLGGT